MNKYILFIALLLVFIFTGCANNNSTRYDGRSYSQIKEILIGKVIETRDVTIDDTGTGTVVGGVVGGALGSTIGGGKGRTLSLVGGALAGAFAGSKLNEKNAQELTVTLNSGKTIVVVTKGTRISNGDRVKIVKDGNNVAAVHKLPY